MVRHHNEGHGRRLTAAFEALEAFPVLAESRNRVLRLFAQERPATADVVTAVESDVALAIATLRLANRVDGRSRGRVDSVVRAVSVLSPAAVQALASRARTFDFFERSGIWEGTPERFRLHGVATQRAADRLAAELGYEERDRLMVTSLLHDVGKLVLAHAYPGYPRQVHGDAKTPEERIHRERRELGVDHALVGGVLARRWGLPRIDRLDDRAPPRRGRRRRGRARAARRHARPLRAGRRRLPERDAASARARSGSARRSCAPSCTTCRTRRTGSASASSTRARSRRARSRCSERLGQGKVYKQIAHELALSTSTVRTHLHNIYGKLGAVDRAQAVLIATERGWI